MKLATHICTQSPLWLQTLWCQSCEWWWPNYTHHLLNSLWPTHTILPHRSGWTLAQVLAYGLMAPCHYLNQYCHIMNGALRHTSKINLMGRVQDISSQNEKYTCKITYTPLRANELSLSCLKTVCCGIKMSSYGNLVAQWFESMEQRVQSSPCWSCFSKWSQSHKDEKCVPCSRGQW